MTTVPERPQGFFITIEQIFETVTRTERTLDGVVSSHRALSASDEDHEKRIRAMEAQIWKWAGAAAALGISGGFGLSKIFGG
jgi:hypothetical protein